MSTRVLRELQKDLGLSRHTNRILTHHVIDIDTRDDNVTSLSGNPTFDFTFHLPDVIRNVVFVELVYLVTPSLKLADLDGYVVMTCPELMDRDEFYIPFSYLYWHINSHLSFPLILERGIFCKSRLESPISSVKQLTISLKHYNKNTIVPADIESYMMDPYSVMSFNLYSIPRIETLNMLRSPSDPHHFLRQRYKMIVVDSKLDPNFTGSTYKFRVKLDERLTRPKSVRLIAVGFPPLGNVNDINQTLSHVEICLPQLNAEWQVQNTYYSSSNDMIFLQTDPLHVHHLKSQDLVTLDYIYVEVFCMKQTSVGPPALFSKVPLTTDDTVGKKQCTLVLHFTQDAGMVAEHRAYPCGVTALCVD